MNLLDPWKFVLQSLSSTLLHRLHISYQLYQILHYLLNYVMNID